jgi:hypothetical protein
MKGAQPSIPRVYTFKMGCSLGSRPPITGGHGGGRFHTPLAAW